jgi:hypothetical protein
MKEQTKEIALATLRQKEAALQQNVDALRNELSLIAATIADMELEQCED